MQVTLCLLMCLGVVTDRCPLTKLRRGDLAELAIERQLNSVVGYKTLNFDIKTIYQTILSIVRPIGMSHDTNYSHAITCVLYSLTALLPPFPFTTTPIINSTIVTSLSPFSIYVLSISTLTLYLKYN